jgi:hypothetical protein
MVWNRQNQNKEVGLMDRSSSSGKIQKKTMAMGVFDHEEYLLKKGNIYDIWFSKEKAGRNWFAKRKVEDVS